MHHDYAPRGVQFYYIYKSLAHPGLNNYVTPYTVEERLAHIAIAKSELRTKVDWLCDTITNDVKHALGDAPNAEFVIDPQGKIVRQRRWSDPDQLREDLEELVGPVDRPTRIADLDVRRFEPAKQAPKGVVPRLELPGRMSAVKIAPDLSDAASVYYVKLRAEADDDLLRDGRGKLYLGFFLDPIYRVHWNNKAGNIAYTIEGPNGSTISPAKGQGPKVEESTDSDPREFLVDIELPSGGAPGGDQQLSVTAHYIACDDAETFCVPVSQTYQVTLERDRDGGRRRAPGQGRGGRGDFAGGPGRADRGARMRERIMSFDYDEDGRVDVTDLPERMQTFLARADSDGDGVLDESELADFRPHRPGGPGGPRLGRRGGNRIGDRPEGGGRPN